MKDFSVGGAIRTPKDYRQVNLEHVAGAAPVAPLPPGTSFHVDFSQVPDFFQRKIGACQNHAIAEILTHRFQRLNGSSPLLSPRFTYTLSKCEDGIADLEEQGTYGVQGFKVAVKYGIATQTTVPNDTTLAFDDYIYHRTIAKMPQNAFTEADKYRIPGYVQVGQYDNVTAQQLLQALQREPDGILIQIAVGAEWYTTPSGVISWQANDIIPIRKVVTAIDDHDITMTGIEADANGRVKIFFRNHWSTDWAAPMADNGWLWLDQHAIVEAWMPTEIPDALLDIIKSLPAQKDFNHTWSTDLEVGSTSADVQALQVALKIAGTFPFMQPTTTYLGGITAGAVMAFQKEYNIADAATIAANKGRVGPATRAVLNKMFSHK